MNHPTEQDLHRLHDGELPVDRAAMVRRHVAECDPCQLILAAYAAVGEAVRSASLPVPSAQRMNQWVASVRAAQEQAVRRLAGWLTTAAAAAIVLAVANYQPAASKSTTAGLAVSPWETTMLSPDEAEAGSAQLAAANWMAADLSAGQKDASWR